MTTLSASLRLRPTRIGFLVDPLDRNSLQKIFRVCTCLWGGAYNPIIPVCDTLPDDWRNRPLPGPTPIELTKGYLGFFEPDVFVEAVPGLAEKARIPRTNLQFGESRVVLIDEYFKAETRRRSIPFGSNIVGVYKELYEREFKFVRRRESRVAIFNPEGSDDHFTEAAFGAFPTIGPLEVLSNAYVESFDPVQLVPNAESWLRVVREGFRLPLNFTREGIKRDLSGWDQPTLFVADPTSTLDLIDLWNVRQFRSQILPINFSWFREIGEFLVEFVKANYRPLPGNPNGVMIHPMLQFGRSISEEKARAAVADVGLTQLSDTRWALQHWYDRIWDLDRTDLIAQPERARLSAATSDFEVNVGRDPSYRNCRFTSLAPDFATPHGDGSARWVNVLKLQTYGEDENLALTLPSSFTGDESQGLRLGSAALISREGFVLPQRYKQHREYLRLFTGREAVIAWLEMQGLKAEPSDPGRIADQIFASLGGLWGVPLIANRETLRLLDEMSKSVRKHTDGRVEEFPDRTIEVKRWKDHIHRRANTGIGRRADLDAFIKAKVFRLGLTLQCTNCMKKNWFGIENLKEELICERCLQSFPFPQGSLNFDRTPWQYRVVGPFSVPDFAGGAYATVLTLHAFGHIVAGDRVNLTYATGLHFTIGDNAPFEVDLTFWYQRREMFDLEEEPLLAFGEAKSFAADAFKQEDLERMQKLATQFPGAFLIFSTLKDELNDEEKREIGRFALWGRERLPDGKPRAPVIVLTGAELFSAWSMAQSWKDAGGQRAQIAEPAYMRFDNLWTLAEATQQVYLELPHPHARSQPLQ